jgi:protein-disulfide isomerase
MPVEQRERIMSQLKPSVGPDDHIQGSINAPIILVEYGDFECPYCGEAYPEIKAAQRQMGDSLGFVFRNFPLNNAHPHAEKAAEFAEAAATVGRFWEMHDMLYENQEALDDESLVGYANRLKLGRALIESAIRGDFAAPVRDDFRSGVRSGVNGTPSLFLNGERYDGPRDAGSLVAIMQRML